MSELSALKAIADAATNSRNEMDDLHREHYAMPNDGAFVGEHTGFMVIEGPTVKALLAVVEAAEDLLDVFNGEADDLASCSYFRGEGACGFGCRDEPSCMTDIPEGGWPSSRLSAALAALHDTEGR